MSTMPCPPIKSRSPRPQGTCQTSSTGRLTGESASFWSNVKNPSLKSYRRFQGENSASFPNSSTNFRHWATMSERLLPGMSGRKPAGKRGKDQRSLGVLIDTDWIIHLERGKAVIEPIGGRIGLHDAWIAATCLANGLTLVTGNIREFKRVPGLKVENWD